MEYYKESSGSKMRYMYLQKFHLKNRIYEYFHELKCIFDSNHASHFGA